MSRIILWCLPVLFCHHAYGQKCVIANDKMNIAYVAIPNSISIAVEGYACKDISVSVTNGELKPGHEPCSYQWYPKDPDRATVSVASGKQKGRILGNMEFRVKRIPDPVAMVGGKQGGEIRKAVLLAQPGIVATLMGFDFDARFTITGYTVTIIHGQQGIFTENCTSAFFTKSTTGAFRKLQTGDRVIFSEIKCRNPDGRITELLPVEFYIID